MLLCYVFRMVLYTELIMMVSHTGVVTRKNANSRTDVVIMYRCICRPFSRMNSCWVAVTVPPGVLSLTLLAPIALFVPIMALATLLPRAATSAMFFSLPLVFRLVT